MVAPRTGEGVSSTAPSSPADRETPATSPVWRMVLRTTSADNQRDCRESVDRSLNCMSDGPTSGRSGALRRSVHGIPVPSEGLPEPGKRGRVEKLWHLTASVGTLEVTQRRVSQSIDSIGATPECVRCLDLHWPWQDCAPAPAQYELFPEDRCQRGRIRLWSNRSKNRMMKRLATLDYESVGELWEMLTLTYPGSFPADGPTCKRHFRTFQKRYERKWGKMSAVWKFEFQRRGAPHFHLYVHRPAVSWREWKAWCARAWYEVVGSGDERHLRSGVRVDRQFCARTNNPRAIAWYFAKHQSHAGAKAYQNEVPVGFSEVGRFWGVVGLESTEESVEVGERLATELARTFRKLRRADHRGGRRVSLRGGSVWVLSWDPIGTLRRLIEADVGPPVAYLCQHPKSPSYGELRTWPPGVPRPIP